MKHLISVILVLFLTATAGILQAQSRFVDVPPQKARYAIVCSKAVTDDKDWQVVVSELENKYSDQFEVKKFLWTDTVQEAFPGMVDFQPKYTCFVAKPTEADRKFVQTVHICTRILDNDIYTDTVWAILTGYDASDALRIASAKPTTVVKGAGGTGIALERFDSGICFDEGRQKHYKIKASGQGVEDKNDGPEDSTKALAEAFDNCQLFVTSGHATEKDWQPGYSYRNGCFISDQGQLYGRLLDGSRFEINSNNPKIWLAAGNCLIGHISDMNCMTLAAIHSGCVHQMAGYTVPTWFGYMGWGVQCYYLNQPGRFTFAESVYASNQALTYRFAKYLSLPTRPSRAEVQKALDGFKDLSDEAKKQVQGLNFDQNVFALYGDPAWSNPLAQQDQGWKQEFSKQNKGSKTIWTFTITPSRIENPYSAVNSGRPIFAFLPERISDQAQIVNAGDEPANPLEAVLTDDFILVPTEALPADQPTTIRILCP